MKNGNSVTHSHDITVIDPINPTGIVEAPFIFEINDGCHWVVEDLRSNVVANDNCGNPSDKSNTSNWRFT